MEHTLRDFRTQLWINLHTIYTQISVFNKIKGPDTYIHWAYNEILAIKQNKISLVNLKFSTTKKTEGTIVRKCISLTKFPREWHVTREFGPDLDKKIWRARRGPIWRKKMLGGPLHVGLKSRIFFVRSYFVCYTLRSNQQFCYGRFWHFKSGWNDFLLMLTMHCWATF